jgi:uncharacterized protein
MAAQYNLDSGAFAGEQAQWDMITVPMLTVGNWSGMGLHLRGNAEAFMRAASKHKKLRIHSGTHVHPFYTEEGRREQLHGRTAGQTCDPTGRRRGQVAL